MSNKHAPKTVYKFSSEMVLELNKNVHNDLTYLMMGATGISRVDTTNQWVSSDAVGENTTNESASR